MLDHLGDACWRLGQTREAIDHWTAAVAAVTELGDDALVGNDTRRVRNTTQGKIDAAVGGGEPAVAPLAVRQEEEEVKPENEVDPSAE